MRSTFGSGKGRPRPARSRWPPRPPRRRDPRLPAPAPRHLAGVGATVAGDQCDTARRRDEDERLDDLPGVAPAARAASAAVGVSSSNSSMRASTPACSRKSATRSTDSGQASSTGHGVTSRTNRRDGSGSVVAREARRQAPFLLDGTAETEQRRAPRSAQGRQGRQRGERPAKNASAPPYTGCRTSGTGRSRRACLPGDGSGNSVSDRPSGRKPHAGARPPRSRAPRRAIRARAPAAAATGRREDDGGDQDELRDDPRSPRPRRSAEGEEAGIVEAALTKLLEQLGGAGSRSRAPSAPCRPHASGRRPCSRC